MKVLYPIVNENLKRFLIGEKMIKKIMLIICLIIYSVGLSAKVQEPQSTKAKLIQIADHYEKSFFEHFPEVGLFWGRSDVALDRFMDHSFSAHEAWQVLEDRFLSDLEQLNEEDLKNTPEHVTYLLLKQSLENNKAARICKEELWYVEPLAGWHNQLAMVAERQPVGTSEYRTAALNRWQSFDKVVEQEINNLKIGLKQGYTAPKPAVERVLKQLNIIVSASVENSPYYDLAKRDNNPGFKKQIALIIERKINPALKRYAKFLEEEYYSLARAEVGVSALPQGKACYQAKIKKDTTLDITPEEIHQYGLQHIAQLTKEISAIGYKKYGTTDVAEIFRRAKNDPRYFFSAESEMLSYAQAALDRVKAKTSLWFDRTPKAAGIIKPYPLHRAITGAPGEYHPPSEDGTSPGIYYINTYQSEKRSKIDQEATLFHELIPGHHFQIALAFEDNRYHNINKYLFNSGFGEGWALYAEKLADEMGLYSDDISRLGMLANEALRAARLVVDPGIHVMNWNREQAISYLKQYTVMGENIIESEVDRYIMLPGQATSYMVGKREIERLRQLCKDRLKDKFDIRQFHNQVLKNGTVTLPMLNQQVENWLEEQG